MDPHDISEILVEREVIARRVDQLAEAIARDTPAGETLLVVGILRGSFIFLADLVRSLHAHGVATCVDFLTVSSYQSATESSGAVDFIQDLREEVQGRPVLLVDDILDTGRTLRETRRLFLDRGAASVRTCVLLDKKARRAVEMEADYAGFSIPDHFVVGYGLDYASLYRELPHIAKVSFPDS